MAHAAFVTYAEQVLVALAAPRVLEIDAIRCGRPAGAKVDLSGIGGLLGQAAGRTAAGVVSWLDEHGSDGTQQGEVAAMADRP